MQPAQLIGNQAVDINVVNGNKSIEPTTPKSATLDDLLAGITQDNTHDEGSFGRPVGKEIL